MADLSDVENALVTLISASIYPNGTGGASAVGAPCRIYRGWPNQSALNTDLAAGTVNVTVFSEAGGRNTTRYGEQPGAPTITPSGLTVTVAEPTVTFAGALAVNAVAGIRTNATGPYVYQNTTNAALSSAAVATALAALIPGASASGSVVTLSPSAGVQAGTAGTATSLVEYRRQVQSFRISCWCPTTALRDATAGLIDAAMASTHWIGLADGTSGRLIYRWSFVNDVPTKDALWRRDFRYDVEYGTTAPQTATQMLFGGGDLIINSGTTGTFGNVY